MILGKSHKNLEGDEGSSGKVGSTTFLKFDVALRTSLEDVVKGLKLYRLASFLAFRESFLPFKLGFLGPLWITIQLGLWVLAISFFVGPSLQIEGGHYVTYCALGFAIYQLFLVFFTEGSQLFIKAKSYILNVPNPFSVYALKLLFKALIQLLMAVPVVVAAMCYTGLAPSVTSLWVLPGLFLTCVFGFGAGLGLATISVIARDMTFAIQALMRLMMFVTPIFWILEGDGARAKISSANPIHIYLKVTRGPLLGVEPSYLDWATASALASVACIIGFGLFASYRNRLAVWL